MSTRPEPSRESAQKTPAGTNPPGLSRRSFLGGVGGAAAAAAAMSTVALEPIVRTRPAGAAEIGPAIGGPRLDAAYESRVAAADRMFAEGIPAHPCNGDEVAYPTHFASYSKGLPHDAIGEVAPDAYEALLAALESGEPADFEAIPLAGTRRLTNPQAGLAFDTEGNDPQQFTLPPAPAFASAEAAAEAVELYWMALLRDVHFADYASSDLAGRAAAELSSLTGFRGPRRGGAVTRQTLFRDDLPGATEGPYVSQFLLLAAPFGAEFILRRMRTLRPGSDHLTGFGEWLAVQRGELPGAAQYDRQRRYIRNGRDLSEWVHVDVLFQAYFQACLILGTPPDPANRPTGGGMGCPLNPGNPYLASATQDPFGTWGGPAFKALIGEVATRCLKAVWFQKWFVHRRLRPEAFGGRIEVHEAGLASYPIHPDALGSEAVDRARHRYGTRLLPMAFPEGAPTHPAYGAGHATVAGGCVTILKALFDERFEIPHPVVPNAAGTTLRPWNGGVLTVGGELNKLASNIATGRNHAGVHWRSDAAESLRLGEAVAIALLRDHKATFHEGGGYLFTRFDGTPVAI